MQINTQQELQIAVAKLTTASGQDKASLIHAVAKYKYFNYYMAKSENQGLKSIFETLTPELNLAIEFEIDNVVIWISKANS